MEEISKKIEKTIKRHIKIALKNDEVPIAAVIVRKNKIISASHNKRNKSNLTIDHAEISAIIKANKILNSWRLNDCIMYVTIEPCEMCKKVIIESRISKTVYLIPRLKNKNQYKKAKFELITENNYSKKNVEKYKKIIENFWQNKR